MENLNGILNNFINQALSGDLKTSFYPKEWSSLRMKVSFGMGAPARIPWIAFPATEMTVSNGFYPVYLFYKDFKTLILSYGISETSDFPEHWPIEIINNSQTIKAYFDTDVKRYGNSFVFKAYKIENEGEIVKFLDESSKQLSDVDLESDLETILNYYKGLLNQPLTTNQPYQPTNPGLFYMEKQLEDFIIHNWDSTELSKSMDLIIEEGELISQQFRTEIGPIDILAKDKKSGGHVVIELKKNQTSDDTVGQLARYMGWIKANKNDDKVRGIIIAGEYDKKLDYALKVVENVEVYLYKVDFTLNEFSKST